MGAWAAVLLAVSGHPPERLSAQAPATFAGTVIRTERGDTVTVPGILVRLHRVFNSGEGAAIDSVRTDARGRWRFRVHLAAEANYLVNARYAGIEFFSPPLSQDAARPDTGVRVLVADTTSGPAARVTVQSRHLLIQGGDSAGWRGVADAIVFDNSSGFTRIASDTLHPSLVFLLPPQAREPELVEGDVGPEAVRFKNGALEIYSPLAPGVTGVTLQYLLPAAADVGIPFGDTVTTFNLLVDGEGTTTAGPRLEGPVPTQMQGRTLKRWSAPVPAGNVLQLDLRAAKTTPTWLLVVLVLAMATGLVTALVVAQRRRPLPA